MNLKQQQSNIWVSLSSLIWPCGSLPSWPDRLLGLMHEVSVFAADKHAVSCICGWCFISRQTYRWLELSEYLREESFPFHHTLLLMLLIHPAFRCPSSSLLAVVAVCNSQSLSILVWLLAAAVGVLLWNEYSIPYPTESYASAGGRRAGIYKRNSFSRETTDYHQAH